MPLTRQLTALLTFLFAFGSFALAQNPREQPTGTAESPPEEVETIPELRLGSFRAGVGDDELGATVQIRDVDSGITRVEWTFMMPGEAFVEAPALISPPGYETTVDPAGEGAYRMTVSAPADAPIQAGETVGRIVLDAPGGIVLRRPVEVRDPVVLSTEGREIIPDSNPSSVAISLIVDPVLLLAFLAGVVGFIYWLASFEKLGTFFKYAPPLIWMYFVPMVTTTLGITPDSSPLYSNFMSGILLPAVLVLLLIPSDLKGLAKLGPKAILMMLIASAGIVTGAIVSFGLFNTFFGDSLPAETWKGIGALAGSWIGGSTNMFAVIESVKTPPSIIGPLVVVDTVVAYTWLGVLIALAGYQERIDARYKAKTGAVEELSMKLLTEQKENARRPGTPDIAFMVAVALVVSQVCLWLGGPIFNIVQGTPLRVVNTVVSAYGWTILLITAVGLILATTPVRRLEYSGASSLGYVGLYVLLTSYGARANLGAVLDVPLFFAIAILWLAIHIVFLYVGLRLLRVPLFMAATSSMANMGGTASAPVVAASYNGSMAPVGLLMAILGGTVGTPLAFFVAYVCKTIAGG